MRRLLRFLYVVCGDAIAALFVGTSLAVGYEHFASISGLPTAVGFVVPLLVYRFATWWNNRPFAWRQARRIVLLMGTFFYLVHHVDIPWLWMTALGYVAPLVVSAFARHAGARVAVAAGTAPSPAPHRLEHRRGIGTDGH